MRIEGVSVCVNYADILAHTLPHNRQAFDRMVVVTTPEDEATQRVCEYYHVECVQTDVFFRDGDTFNKGAAIDHGLGLLSKLGWVVHLDADIYLPPKTRFILENLPLDDRKIYGIDRLMVTSHGEWMSFLSAPRPIQESWVFIHLDSFPVGCRIAEYANKDAGYTPIGYFQLWSPGGSGVWGYPTEHGTCDRTDVLHAKKWSRCDRELLPELVCLHLDSEAAKMGTNWEGRKTRRFSQP